MIRSRLVHVVVVVTVLVTGWLLFGARALAIQDSEDKVWFGPVGVGAGQGVRINVYGLGSSGTGGIVPTPTVPWEFTVRIFNRRGDVMQERQFQLAPGAIGSFEVNVGNPDTLPVDRLGRRTLRAEIVGFNPQPDPPGKFGATLVGNPDVLAALQPPPDPESDQ